MSAADCLKVVLLAAIAAGASCNSNAPTPPPFDPDARVRQDTAGASDTVTPGQDTIQQPDANLADTTGADASPDSETTNDALASDSSADTPSDATPSPTILTASATSAIEVDGFLDEWSNTGWQQLSPSEDFVATFGTVDGPMDLSARFAARWSPDRLFLAFEVTDDISFNIHDGNPQNIWRGDCVQAAFDAGNNGGLGYDGVDDYEFGWALARGKPTRYRWVAPVGAAGPTHAFAIRRLGSKTVYEIGMPPSDLGLPRFEAGATIGFSLVVNEADEQERVGYLQWTPGIGGAKNPGEFGSLHFAP